MKTAKQCSLFSLAKVTLSWISTTACVVEDLSLKPYCLFVKMLFLFRNEDSRIQNNFSNNLDIEGSIDIGL